MYEKHGLMSRLSNPVVLAWLRKHTEASHTQLIENALRRKLGLALRECKPEKRGRSKIAECRNDLPVKVKDPQLVDHLITQRRVYGVSHRHTIESAVLDMVLAEER